MSSIFEFLGIDPFFGHFTVNSGCSGGTSKIANFGRNFAISSSEVVKTIRNRRQNDRQSTPENFYCWFGVKKSTFDQKIAILPFFWSRPVLGPVQA